MNHFEKLYEMKTVMENEIRQHIVFRVTLDVALQRVFEKLGTIYYIFLKGEPNKIQDYFRTICHTNQTEVNYISFVQQSMMWIVRWCCSYCGDTNSDVEIKADDVLGLMGIAYSYDKFIDIWNLHNRKKVTSFIEKEKVIFSYVDETTYQMHVCYDTYTRLANNKKQINDLRIHALNGGFDEVMSQVHKSDFTTSFDVDFGEFSLKDYRKFTCAINDLIAENISEIFDSSIVLANQVGFHIKSKGKWIEFITQRSGLPYQRVESIINFITYRVDNTDEDISLSYFIQTKNGLLLSEEIFNLSRPEINILRLLAKRNTALYDRAQNNWESEERNYIQTRLSKEYLAGYGKEKELAILPGMDLLVYCPVAKHLQVIELKYRLPIDSARDLYNLDANLLDKAYRQVETAKVYYRENQDVILKKYFGDLYTGVIPDQVDFFVITNDSVGTGIGHKLPTPILEINDYIQLMKLPDGMNLVHKALCDKKKLLPIIKKQKGCAQYKLFSYKILIPEFLVQFGDNRVR